ncbi:hypothetical protein HY839_04045 [Candidatus Azambacteria bacterium]|nr:hypothetical protein [Candidatus Azambacteria bacterium]
MADMKRLGNKPGKQLKESHFWIAATLFGIFAVIYVIWWLLDSIIK